MKISFKLLILSITSTISSLGAIPSKPKAGISMFRSTPFYLDGKSTTFFLTTTATSSEKVRCAIKLVNDLYPSGVSLYAKIFSSRTTVQIEYDNKYTRPSGNMLYISQTISGVTNEYNQEINVASGRAYSINSSIYDYKSSYFYYSLSNGKWSNLTEELKLHNFEDYYIPNYYHKIDLSNFYIEIVSSVTTTKLMNNGGMFRITNKDGLFDSFTHDSTYAYFPLEIVKDGNVFSLAFKDTLYVDPLTLTMSSANKDNYVSTRHLYLPINEKKNENAYNCSISIKEIGICGETFVTNFKYKSLLNTFGDCNNSEYCIRNS